jgi:steroid delta-isomerase-like uncharacterized protein
MQKVSFALAVGFMLCACGGGEEPKVPEMEPTPVATTPPPPDTAEAPPQEPKATMAELQQKAVTGMFEALNAHDSKKLAGFYAENAVVNVAGTPGEATGRDAIAVENQKIFDAFSNAKYAPARVWMKDDVVVTEWAFNGTHSGDLHGIKATEKPVGFMGASVAWFTPEGLIKQENTYYDMGTVMSQIGKSKQKARAVPTLPASPQVFTSSGSADEAKNLEAVKQMWGAFETKKDSEFTATLTDDVEWDDMTEAQTSKGKDSAKKFFVMMIKAFPDGKMSTTNTWTVGEYVVSEGSFTGTHKGPFFGIRPTQKQVTMRGLDIMQVKDGKVAKGWSYSNSADLMAQLGLLPQPGAQKAGAADKKAEAADKKADAKPATAKPATAPAKN